MFAASVTFVLILFAADGSVSYIPGWHTLRSCQTANQVILNASEDLTPSAHKRPVAGHCVAQFGTGEGSNP